MIHAAVSADHTQIIHVWELSVRATHDFLPEDYLQEIKEMLPAILAQVPHLHVWKSADNSITGFSGVADGKIEMLFIHPDHRGCGIGKQLMNFCIEELKADQVDVNEQNTQAVGFYRKHGFVQTGYQSRDGLGRDLPIIQMELKK